MNDNYSEAAKLVNKITNDDIIPRVTKGFNCIDTCLQFRAHLPKGKCLMTLKVYDKVIDLVAREALMNVGSRFRNLIGATYTQGALQKVVFERKLHGCTRIEVSIHLANDPHQNTIR